ncbi:MAG: HAMP domain-containing histidine kinase [Epsilonproteobacteria bacterium]|nr:HAMP domain-containing histidine kinase [Campylobacterota bacterium]
MQRNAVLITVLFALFVSLISVSAVFWEFYKLNKQQYIDHIFTKYSLIAQVYREHIQSNASQIMLEANLAVYDLYIVKDKTEKREIIKTAKLLKKEGFKSYNTSLMINKNGFFTKNSVVNLEASMLQYLHKIYFYIEGQESDVLIKDELLHPYSYVNILYVYATVFAVIAISFILVLQKLRPLIRLRKKIALYGQGNMDISFCTKNQDEIGSIANELEKAKNKINTILESRTLFLRNLMHELKTPIAKGTIATQMLDSPKQKERFNSIFKRLETFVEEFALVEEVTSLGDMTDFKEYRLVDIIDGAIDMAMVDRSSVTVKLTGDVKIKANYRLYTTAIKNMIDNGIKYSDDTHVTIFVNDRGELCFESKGERLKHSLQYYIEPFTKENPSKNSFGLGLYLVDSILKAHGRVLAYEYEEGRNRFIFA